MLKKQYWLDLNPWSRSIKIIHLIFILLSSINLGMRCMDCGYNCHDKCQQYVPKNCQKLRTVHEVGVNSATMQPNGATVPGSTNTACKYKVLHYQELEFYHQYCFV